ncbi:MAG TPA: BatA domain-containing protein [Bacteroidia bacterium]|nr:BatA domain-containing protein [Bacteroidia bacterium]HQF28435.1 BatA domain-containing protein [Bacteroidia bacterium]
MIRFLTPNFLYALSLLAIPVIIHLFNFRRFKKVVFTNVRFLQELKEETTRVSKLKHLLVLACRLLAVMFLVFAFAQPIIPIGKAGVQSAQKNVSVFVDNSFSMEGVTKDGSLLEVAKKKATEIVNAYPPTTRFQLLTNDFQSVHQRLITKDEFLDELSRVKISPISRNLSSVIERQKEAFSQQQYDAKDFFIVSDFQSSTSDLDQVKSDSLMNLNIVSLPVQATANAFIDTCSLNSPVVLLNKPSELNVVVSNGGEEDLDNIPVKLSINGSQRAVATVSVPAGKSVTTTMSFTVTVPGWQKLEVSIVDQPITFDDKYYLSFEVKQELNVLSLDGHNGGPYLKALFGQDPFFKFNQVPVNQVDYSSLQKQDLVILNELPALSSGLSAELMKYLSKGGSIIWFPDSSADLSGYNQFLQQIGGETFTGIESTNDKVENIDLKSPIFSDIFEKNQRSASNIDYPVTSKHFVFTGNTKSSRQVLMSLQSGAAFLSEYSKDKGKVFLFAVPLTPGFSNLARHAIVVPMLYKIALYSMHSPAMMSVIGGDASIEVEAAEPGGEETFHLTNAESKIDLIPMHRVLPGGIAINANDQIPVAGQYDLAVSGKNIATLSFNYNRKESVMQFSDEATLQEKGKSARIGSMNYYKPTAADLTKTLNQLAEGISLWKYCIILVLLFLLAETLILRYWKTS